MLHLSIVYVQFDRAVKLSSQIQWHDHQSAGKAQGLLQFHGQMEVI